MGSTRTQIYLTDDIRARVDTHCARTGESLAEVVRVALDHYLSQQSAAARRTALEQSFGAIPDFEVPPRSEWDRGYG